MSSRPLYCTENSELGLHVRHHTCLVFSHDLRNLLSFLSLLLNTHFLFGPISNAYQTLNSKSTTYKTYELLNLWTNIVNSGVVPGTWETARRQSTSPCCQSVDKTGKFLRPCWISPKMLNTSQDKGLNPGHTVTLSLGLVFDSLWVIIFWRQDNFVIQMLFENNKCIRL